MLTEVKESVEDKVRDICAQWGWLLGGGVGRTGITGDVGVGLERLGWVGLSLALT